MSCQTLDFWVLLCWSGVLELAMVSLYPVLDECLEAQSVIISWACHDMHIIIINT
jgi:hypothetical protein